MKTKFVYLAMLSFTSGSAFGLGMVNETCIGDPFKPYKDLVQQVSIFPEDNRVIFEKHFKEFGFTRDDVDQIRSAIGEVFCPGTTHKNQALLAGLIVESGDTLVTNKHALIDENGQIREPLSDCFFRTQAEFSAGLPGHHFMIEKGDQSYAQALKSKILAVGTNQSHQFADDWAVIKLSAAPANVRPFKLPNARPALHKCAVSEPSTCQKLIAITAHDHQVPGVGTPPLGSSVIQSYYLYNLKRAETETDIPSRILGDASAIEGSSGGINFLVGDDGKPVKENSSLVPISIFANGAKVSHNGQEYSLRDGITTESVGLDGTLAEAIKAMSGTK